MTFRPPPDTRHLLHGLLALWPSYLAYVVTFMRHNRLLVASLDPAGARAIGRRFRLALVWLATGTALGALVPALGVAVIAAFIPYYWLPISGELLTAASRNPSSE